MRSIKLGSKRHKSQAVNTYDGPLLSKENRTLNINSRNFNKHEKRLIELNNQIGSLTSIRAVLSIELIDYMRRKGITKLGDQTRVEGVGINWDLNAVKRFIKEKDIISRAKKANIDLSKVITVWESVDRKIMEALLKAEVVTEKDVKKVMHTYPRGGYLRQKQQTVMTHREK